MDWVHWTVRGEIGKVCGVGVGMLARDGEVAVLGSGNGGGEGNGNGGEISGMDIQRRCVGNGFGVGVERTGGAGRIGVIVRAELVGKQR